MYRGRILRPDRKPLLGGEKKGASPTSPMDESSLMDAETIKQRKPKVSGTNAKRT